LGGQGRQKDFSVTNEWQGQQGGWWGCQGCKVDNAGFISPIIWQFMKYRDDKMDNGGVGVDVATKNNNRGIGGG
jgi:hypothetical protein